MAIFQEHRDQVKLNTAEYEAAKTGFSTDSSAVKLGFKPELSLRKWELLPLEHTAKLCS